MEPEQKKPDADLMESETPDTENDDPGPLARVCNNKAQFRFKQLFCFLKPTIPSFSIAKYLPVYNGFSSTFLSYTSVIYLSKDKTDFGLSEEMFFFPKLVISLG